MRDGLLFLHIVGVAGWLGGGVYAFHYSRWPDGPAAAGPALRLKKVAAVLWAGDGLVLLSGIGLVLTSDAFGWGDTFVLIGLGRLPRSRDHRRHRRQENSERLAEAARRVPTRGGTQVVATGDVWDLLILAVVIWAMITKLGLRLVDRARIDGFLGHFTELASGATTIGLLAVADRSGLSRHLGEVGGGTAEDLAGAQVSRDDMWKRSSRVWPPQVWSSTTRGLEDSIFRLNTLSSSLTSRARTSWAGSSTCSRPS